MVWDVVLSMLKASMAAAPALCCGGTVKLDLKCSHPDFFLKDLPRTPRKQIEECYRAAKAHLENVTIGNKPLPGLAD